MNRFVPNSPVPFTELHPDKGELRVYVGPGEYREVFVRTGFTLLQKKCENFGQSFNPEYVGFVVHHIGKHKPKGIVEVKQFLEEIHPDGLCFKEYELILSMAKGVFINALP
jgi:hypothetical protein